MDIRRMGALRDPDRNILDREIERARAPLSKKPGNILELRKKLQNVMWDDVGVMRTETGINRGLSQLSDIEAELMETGVDGSNLAFNLTWHDWLNMASLTEISEVIARAGLARENSRGAHFREDFPEPGAMEESYFTVARKAGETLSVSREPVKFTIVRPGETILPEGEPETLVGAN
tara:strand:- start:285 stop:815 length:531 start_codon:yes stop_codon:yes gene_type:complete